MAADSPQRPPTSPPSEGTVGANGMLPTAATMEETAMVTVDDILAKDAPLGSDMIWTKEKNQKFEDALANFDDLESSSVWSEVAAMVPGTDAALVQERFEVLRKDVVAIFTGKTAVPDFDMSVLSLIEQSDAPTSKKQKLWAGQSPGGTANGANGTGNSGKSVSNKADQERRKGIPWSEDEHRLFLLGLKKYGKGDWRSISRNFVISRTPTQVASHAQKYFIRLNSINKDKRRSSIHDITSVNGNGGDALQGGNLGPITGQSPPSATTPAGPPGYYGFHGAPAAQMPFGQMQRAVPMMSPTPMMAAYPMSQQAMNQ